MLIAQANDSWFDGSDLPEAHLRVAVLRAIENRRALLRATLTGVSAIIAPSGRVVSRLEAGRRGALAATVPLMDLRTASADGALWLYRLAAVVFACFLILGRRAQEAR